MRPREAIQSRPAGGLAAARPLPILAASWRCWQIMATEKSLAIVLRVVDFSETSCVVTLFTEDFGKVRGLAKGARRPKGPFEAALDLLAVCRVVFLHKSTDALDLLTEARLERRFRAASRDLARLYAGLYVAELLHDLTDDHDPHPRLFQAALAAISALDDGGEVLREVLRFELTALRELGQLPQLADCVECGCPLVTEATRERVAFAVLAGGVVCPRCKPGKRQVISVSAQVLRWLRTMADAGDDAWRQMPLGPAGHGELRAVMNHYLVHILGHRPRLHRFLGGLTP